LQLAASRDIGFVDQLDGLRVRFLGDAQDLAFAGLAAFLAVEASAPGKIWPAEARVRAKVLRMARLRRLLAVRSWPMIILSV